VAALTPAPKFRMTQHLKNIQEN